MKKTVNILACIAMAMIGQMAYAAEWPDSYGYLGIEGSYYDIQKGKNEMGDVKNFWRPAVQLGYRLNPRFSAQLQYGQATTDARHLAGDVKDRQASASGFLHWHEVNVLGFVPYLAGGYNWHEMKPDAAAVKKTSEDMLFGQLGVQRMLGNHFMVDVGYRHLVSLESDNFVDRQPLLALNYLFGKQYPRKPFKIEPVPAVVPEPIAPRCFDVPAGAKLDKYGCPIEMEESVHITLHIEFAFDSTKVPPRYHADIKEIADVLREYPTSAVLLTGHTDNIGRENYNQNLSLKRADAVMHVLVSEFGVNPVRIQTSGMGMSEPVASNSTDEGRAENRRVEAVIAATKTRFVKEGESAPSAANDNRGNGQ